MSTGLEITALLAALERALAELEVYVGWQPATPLVRLLTRRRHSVRVVRRIIREGTMRTVPPTTLYRGDAATDLSGLILTEDRLAERLDLLLSTLPGDDSFRPIAEGLRAETDDMARALRLIAAQQKGRS